MKLTKTAGWNASEAQLLHVTSNFVEVWSFWYSLLPRSFGVICCNVFSIGYSVCGDKIILHTTHAPCTTLLKAFVHIVWSLHYFAFEKDEAPKVVSFLGGEIMLRRSCGFRGEALPPLVPTVLKAQGYLFLPRTHLFRGSGESLSWIGLELLTLWIRRHDFLLLTFQNPCCEVRF